MAPTKFALVVSTVLIQFEIEYGSANWNPQAKNAMYRLEIIQKPVGLCFKNITQKFLMFLRSPLRIHSFNTAFEHYVCPKIEPHGVSLKSSWQKKNI